VKAAKDAAKSAGGDGAAKARAEAAVKQLLALKEKLAVSKSGGARPGSPAHPARAPALRARPARPPPWAAAPALPRAARPLGPGHQQELAAQTGGPGQSSH
jgi:hypothetical protein